MHFFPGNRLAAGTSLFPPVCGISLHQSHKLYNPLLLGISLQGTDHSAKYHRTSTHNRGDHCSFQRGGGSQTMISRFILLSGVSIIVSGISQVLLKIGASQKKKSQYFPVYLNPYFNWYTLSGSGLLLAVTIISVYILKEMPLKLFFPIFISMNMVVVVILSYLILHESLTYRKIVAIGIIICGVLVACIP